MDVNVTLATYSNYLVYAAMAAYTLAMIAFACVASAATARPRPRAGRRRRRAAATRAPSRSAHEGRRPTRRRAGRRRARSRGRRAGNIAMSLMWLAYDPARRSASLAARDLGGPRALGQHVRVLDHRRARRSRWSSSCCSLSATCAGSASSSSRPVLLTLGLAVTLLYTDAEQLVPALRNRTGWSSTSPPR